MAIQEVTGQFALEMQFNRSLRQRVTVNKSHLVCTIKKLTRETKSLLEVRLTV